MMPGEEPITLKDVQLRLGVPQHVLIHLCEKGVIEPDFAETSGRGKHREFSRRNLFEFGVALALRKFELPVATAAVLVRLLRSFGRAVAKSMPGFELPRALMGNATELALHLYDGRYLVLSKAGGAMRQRLLLGVNMDDAASPTARPRIEKLNELPDQYDAHLEINLSQIARRLFE
jgi:DNA-binding transcriptional MerR regulator